MKMKKIILFVLLAVTGVYAQLSSIPAAFVDVGIGARPAAMGGAYTGLADDINGLLWNPAGLTDLQEKQASFSYAKVFGLIGYNMVSFGMPAKFDAAQQGIGAALLSSGDEALRELTIIVGYARYVGPVSVGINLKFRHASFGNNTLDREDYKIFTDDEFNLGLLNQVTGSANGFGVDFGAMYAIDERIKIGVLLRDCVAPVSWDSKVQNPDAHTKGQYTENLPLELLIGTSFKASKEFTVTADYQPSLDKEVYNTIRGGAELKLWNFLLVRAGLQNVINDLDDEKYTFGFGFKVKLGNSFVLFDYTHLVEKLDNSNRIAVGINF
ncbi:MAG: hypothetical protein LWX56_04690 [Ignavibacteria bacterium]|nr:hypothetical protein [Ignavibacteria bacterium]